MNKIKFEEVQELLDSGKKPEEVFDWVDDYLWGFYVVELHDKYNYLNDKNNKLLSNQWFDECERFCNLFGIVKSGELYNYLTLDGKLLSEQWFDFCGHFHDGFAVVKLNGKYNYINQDGKIVSPDLWFDYCEDFNEGFGIVYMDDKCNFIKPNGKLLCKKWFSKNDE